MKKIVNLGLILVITGCMQVNNPSNITDKKEQNKVLPNEIKSSVKASASNKPITVSSSPIIKDLTSTNALESKKETSNESNSFVSTIAIASSSPSNQASSIALGKTPIPIPTPFYCSSITPVISSLPAQEKGSNEKYLVEGTISISITTKESLKIRYDRNKKEFYSRECVDVSTLNSLVKEYEVYDITGRYFSEEQAEARKKTLEDTFGGYYPNVLSFYWLKVKGNLREFLDKLKNTSLIEEFIISGTPIKPIATPTPSPSCSEKPIEYKYGVDIGKKKYNLKINYNVASKIRYDIENSRFYSFGCIKEEDSFNPPKYLNELIKKYNISKIYCNVQGIKESDFFFSSEIKPTACYIDIIDHPQKDEIVSQLVNKSGIIGAEAYYYPETREIMVDRPILPSATASP